MALTARLEAAFSLLTADEGAARDAFGCVYDRAAAEARPDVQVLCAAGMVLAIAIEYADFRGLACWSQRLVALRVGASTPGPIARMRLDAACLALPCLDHAHAFDTQSEATAMRLLADLLEQHGVAADERILLAKMLMDHLSLQHDVPRMERVTALISEYVAGGGVSPSWQARWWLLLLLNHEYFGNLVAASHARRRANELVAAHGLPAIRFELATIEMSAALKADDVAQATRLFLELDDLRPHARPGRLPQGLRAQALWQVRRGEYGAALDRVQLLLALCADMEVPPHDRGAYEVLRAYCLVGLGRHDEARCVLQSQRPLQHGQQGELLEAIVLTVEAVRQLEAGDPAAESCAVAAIERCAALRFNRFLLPLPHWAARLVEIGWDAGVQHEFLAATVRDRRLVPGDPTRESWPWRLRVHALGELRIEHDDLPLEQLSGKAQRKPLELLRLLAALGGGPVPVEQVIDALWPSLDADAPKAPLEMAVSRLRKMLNLPAAVRVCDGRVALDRALVWIDVAAFETLCEQGHTERALALYHAPLYGREPLRGALREARERLALRHAGLVDATGQHLQAGGDWAAAAHLYELALLRDPLSEPTHRALIQAQLQQGEVAEARRSYQRCRELLSAALGAPLSQQTEALARQAGL